MRLFYIFSFNRQQQKGVLMLFIAEITMIIGMCVSVRKTLNDETWFHVMYFDLEKIKYIVSSIFKLTFCIYFQSADKN